MKKILSLLIMIIFGFAVFAQNEEEIQQLKDELPNSNGSRRIEILKTLSGYYRDKNNPLALAYANEFLDLSRQFKSKSNEADAYGFLGIIHFYEIDYRKAMQCHVKAATIYKQLNDDFQLGVSYFKAASNLMYLHEFDSAKIYNDSAQAIYTRVNNQPEIMGSKIQLGKIYNQSCRLDSAIVVLEDVLNSPEIDLARKTWILYWLGNSYYKSGNFPKAEEAILSSIKNYNQLFDFHGEIGSLQLLGDIYLMKGYYADAYKVFFMGYEKREYVKGDMGRLNFFGQNFINLGNVFFNAGDYKTSIQYYDSALMIGEKYHFTEIIAEAHGFRGHTYIHQNQNDLAMESFGKALEIYTSEHNLFGMAGILNRIAETYFSQHKTELAIETFQKALEINQNIGNIFGEATNLHNLATCFMKVGNYQKANSCLDAGFPLAKQSDVDELVKNYYQTYMTVCELTGKHAELHTYFNLFLAISEKINHSNLRNLTDLLIKYYENGLENEKKMFDNELEIKNLEAEKTRFHLKQMIYITIIIVILALIIISLYINKFLSARKLEKIIEERTKTLRENEQKLIETNKTQDKLYSIIAHDLKSPFNSLIGFANLLQEEYDECTDEERKKYIDIMRTSSEEVFFLLENLLEWTRNSLDDIQFKPIRFDLNKIIKQSITLVEKNATLKNINIQNFTPKNTFVFADEIYQYRW